MKDLAKLISFVCTTLIIFCSIFIYGCYRNNEAEFQGYLEGKYTYLSSAVSGKLEQLFVDRGYQVKKGQVIFILDQEPEISQLQTSQQKLAESQETLINLEKGQRQTVLDSITAQRQQAAADLAYATKTLNRYKELYSHGVIDKNTLDKAQDDYDANLQRVKESEANLDEAKLGARENLIKAQQSAVAGNMAEVKQMQWALDQKTKRAPEDAEVFDKLHEVGEFISAGDPVVNLLPPSTLKVIFFVPERMLSGIRLNEKIEFTCDGCRQRFPAIVSFISPNAEYTPPVIFSFESREKLVYRIEARIDLEIAKQLHTGQPVDVYVSLKK